MSAVLRVSGPFDQLSQSIQTSAFPFIGGLRSKRRHESENATEESKAIYNFTVCESDDISFREKVEECDRYLNANQYEMMKLRDLDGVESICLDFASHFKHLAKYHHFPHDFLKKCVDLGFDLEVSVYNIFSEEE